MQCLEPRDLPRNTHRFAATENQFVNRTGNPSLYSGGRYFAEIVEGVGLACAEESESAAGGAAVVGRDGADTEDCCNEL